MTELDNYYLQKEEPIKGCLLARMKIMLFDPAKDLPVKTITGILKQALALYSGL